MDDRRPRRARSARGGRRRLVGSHPSPLPASPGGRRRGPRRRGLHPRPVDRGPDPSRGRVRCGSAAGARRGRRRRDLDRRRPGSGGLLPLPRSTRRSSSPPAGRSRTSGSSSSTASSPTARLGQLRRGGRRAARPPSRGGVAAAADRTAGAARWTRCEPLSPSSGASSGGDRATTSVPSSCATKALRLCAVVPTGAGRRAAPARATVSNRSRRGTTSACAANYLWMLTGERPSASHVRAVEQYLVLTIDHGFNASTFTARVDHLDRRRPGRGRLRRHRSPLRSRFTAGPRAGRSTCSTPSAPPDRAEAWVRDAVERGDRIMGFGHRVVQDRRPAVAVPAGRGPRRSAARWSDFAERGRATVGRGAGRAQTGRGSSTPTSSSSPAW